jgi:hypothetical protein
MDVYIVVTNPNTKEVIQNYNNKEITMISRDFLFYIYLLENSQHYIYTIWQMELHMV